MYIKPHKLRTFSVFVTLFLILLSLSLRLFYLQVFKSARFKKLAVRQHSLTIKLQPRRGNIYDKNMCRLAVSLRVPSVYAIPRDIEDRREAIEALSDVLNISREALQEKLDEKNGFVWLRRKAPNEVGDRIRELKIKGIGIIEEQKRFYPNSPLAAHIIGFVGLDNYGLEGLELRYNNYLQGEPGWYKLIRDGKRRRVPSLGEFVPAVSGHNLILTIDKVVQYIAEKEAEEACSKYNAKSATIVVMEPESGEILALANRPTFDPNSFETSEAVMRRNRAVCDIFEPGSIFKVVTAAAIINSGEVALDDEVYCEEGSYRIHNRLLHDHRPHGWLTFKDVIAKSSNIGTVKIAQKVGRDRLYHLIRKFGFGSPTLIDLPGEVRGIVRSPDEWSSVDMSTIPMGQGIAVTPIQMACAISAIANNGVMMRPKIVKVIVDQQGVAIKTSRPIKRQMVLSEEACARLKEILSRVVEDGTGWRARVPGYEVAGKTGTAQKPAPNGGYSHTDFIASFIGFAPVENPRVAIVVVVDEPHPAYFGGTVAAPVFRNVLIQTLRYLNAEPEFIETVQLGDDPLRR